MMEEEGVKEGKKIKIKIKNKEYESSGGEIIEEMMEEVGIKENIVKIEFEKWMDKVLKRQDLDEKIIENKEERDIDIYDREKY